MKKMNVQYIDISKIKPYEKNPRYNENSVGPVAESIKEYGFRVPLVLDKENVIVCGHTRFLAAKSLGMQEVPCVIADDLSEEQIKAYRIADNKTADFSIWDNKLLLEELTELVNTDLYTGFTFGDIEEMTLLDEKDNAVIEENEDGVSYEIVFRSGDKGRIERIQKKWEEMGGDDV